MTGPSRRRQGASLPYRIPLWGAVLVSALLLYLDGAPMQLDPSVPTSGGEPTTRLHPADIVCVLDYREIANSGRTFRERDWSAAWVDMLEQHVGPISVVTPSTIQSKHLEEAAAVVVTASAAKSIKPESVERLREFALDGKLVVVERPTGEMRERFAANGNAGLQRARSVTFSEGLSDPYADQLEGMPLETGYVGSTGARDRARTLLALDGAPAIYALPVGEGTVVTVEFDVGEQLVSLQQGRPTSDFRVDSENAGERSPRTTALVTDEALRGSTVPYADLLERFLVRGVLQRYAAFPSLWPFPGSAAGAVIPLHQDRTLGDHGGWMLEYEAQRDASSTLATAVDAGLTPAGAAVIDRRGGELGLLWRRASSPARRSERWGLLGFEPLARPMNLQAQIDRVVDVIPAGEITTVKSAGRWWSGAWARPFRQLTHAGIPLDTSYEPDAKGFAFGTGFPFRVHDRTGLPLDVRELPVVAPGRPSKPFDLEPFLEASRSGHHQVLAYSLAPGSFGQYPNMQRFNQWIDSFERIRRNDHVIWNARQFLAFWRGRLTSRLSSDLLRNVEVPKGEVKEGSVETEPGSGDGVLLRIRAELERSDLAVVVPQSIADRDFDQARRRMSRVAGHLVARKIDTVPTSTVGYDLRRIPLDSGSSRVDIYYR